MEEQNEANLRRKEIHDYMVVFLDNLSRSRIESRGEVDRQLMTLSALAIGLLIGAFDKPQSTVEFWIWIYAGTMFFVCILTGFFVYIVNVIYMDKLIGFIPDLQYEEEEVWKAGTVKKLDGLLRRLNFLTCISFFMFLLGALATIYLAIFQFA